jgi:hypothetical protein
MIEYLTSTFIIQYSIFKYFLKEKAQISELRAYQQPTTSVLLNQGASNGDCDYSCFTAVHA